MKTGRSSIWRRPVSPFVRIFELNLIVAGDQVIRKYAFEPALFVLIVEQDHGSNPQRAAAGVASRHFPLQILQEAIGEAVLIGGAARRLYARLPAMRTLVLQGVFLRVPAQCGPPGITDANCLFGSSAHDLYLAFEPKSSPQLLMRCATLRNRCTGRKVSF